MGWVYLVFGWWYQHDLAVLLTIIVPLFVYQWWTTRASRY